MASRMCISRVLEKIELFLSIQRSTTMYLNRKEKCSPKALFDVPHKAKPMAAASIEKKFPEFAKEMDGCGEERCLLYFWKRNKETKVYEFVDEEAEEEVAELFGVKIYDEEEEAEKAKQKYLQETRALTEQEIKDFKEELAYVSEQMKAFHQGSSEKRLE
jgi:hypothetical protein